MENERFYGTLAEIFEAEKVDDGDVLSEFEAWDSLTKLSIIAMADSEYGKNINARDLDRIRTVGELKAFLVGEG
jgi:acyl carrier protein